MTPPRALDVLRCPLAGTALIEASAGTGKTWAICGLVLRLLVERRLEVQQILVVTFTNAATAELRERIRSRIAQVLAALRAGGALDDAFVAALLQRWRGELGLAEAEIVQRLDLALQTFDEASIFTIHGFCQRALADTPIASGMPMAMELLTDDSALRLEVVQDFWRREVAGDQLSDPLLAHLLARGDSPERWSRLLQRRQAKPLTRLLWPEGLDAVPALDGPALAAAHAQAQASWSAQREAIVAIVDAALPRLNGNVYKAATLTTATASWDRLLGAADPLALSDPLDKLELLTPRRLQPRKGQAPVEPHGFFALAGTLLDRLDAAQNTLALQRLALLRRLLDETPRRLRALKREQRVLAFDDMLLNLHERLVDPSTSGLAAALRARFPAALIDEFQDTDPLQWSIFRSIYGGGDGPLFLVGDPKQAIYSFRNADLHTYLQARGTASAAYTLAENQRSSQALLGGLNGIFARNPQAFMLPGLDYQRVQFGAKPRKAWRDDSLPRAPLQLWQLPDGPDGAPLVKRAARRAALAACAGEIARLLSAAQRGEIAHGDAPLAGGDIAVLVRSHAQGGEMRRALAALGVGSVELSQASVFESSDAEQLERVLQAVLEPSREGLLRAALATDLLGVDAAGIDALSADEPRLLDALTRFAGYRVSWQQRGVGVMLRAMRSAEGIDARLLGRADGERRMTNLLHLCECLQQAEAEQAAPERLLRWLQTQRAAPGNDDAAQLRLESDRNLVQIVTIHKSKGLEYPVVFCPLLWDGHPGRSGDGLEGLAYHDAEGRPVLDLRDGPGDAAVAAQIALERSAEQLRLIYVALTRAVQRCVLVVGSYLSPAGRALSSTQSARSLLNWLVAGAGQTPAEWAQGKPTPEAIAAAWAAFAQAHAGSVALDLLPNGPWAAFDAPRPAADTLAALPPPAQLPAPWWIGSYSSLMLGARHDGVAVDHDARVEPVVATDDTPIELADDDILHFPRGAQAGHCMHALFERVDYADARGWPEAIDAALRERPPGQRDGVPAERHPRMLARMLDDVLHTPLGGGLRLAEVPRARRLVELEFHLPARQVGAAALGALLRAHGVPVPALGFGVLDGYLRGFIDLVFEHGGRFHLLDWKSNHLGQRPADYAPAALAQAMQQHGYQLQALLYAVALHRHLQDRVPGYRYDTHFGGALYLFVRGVRPAWQTADGQPTGVVNLRPPLELVERLSALFDEVPA